MVSPVVRRCVVVSLSLARALAAAPACAEAPCADLVVDPTIVTRHEGDSRTVRPVDLLRLRQIGEPEAMFTFHPALALSPDRRHVAFVIQRADPEANRYCMGLAVLDLDRPGPPRLLNAGGSIILTVNSFRGRIWGVGYPSLTIPRWSPDSRSIAWLRRDDGSTQVWLADVATGDARAVTHEAVDVEAVSWSANGEALIYASRTGQIAERAAFAREGRSGFHYDDRFVPIMSDRPMPDASIGWSSYSVDLASGARRPAREDEVERLPDDELGKFPPLPVAKGDDGRVARARHSTGNPLSPLMITVSLPSGTQIACRSPRCEGRIVDMWWTPDAKTLVFLRREGWAHGLSGLYRWAPGQGEPERLVLTHDLISNCVLAMAGLVCLRETSTQPQRLVRFDVRSGKSELLYDPNPEWASFRFGTVRHLQWSNDAGAQVRGDLVLPPGYEPGTRVPLIVTTYTSNGFLRGGMGDEYPIHPFAAAGFAVLSYNAPERAAASDPDLDSREQVGAAGTRTWLWRRAVESAIERGIDRVVEMGVADPRKVGITGLSDGSTSAAFAMINSRRFAAASVSTCCMEPWAVNAGYGPAFARLKQGQGYAPLTAHDDAFWKHGSLVANAARIETPLLMQLADREYLGGVDVYAALREQGKPVDMYVFPDAFHHKWQPAQKLAAYQRNIDWFAFWLQGKTVPGPNEVEEKAGTYAHWNALAAGWKPAKTRSGP